MVCSGPMEPGQAAPAAGGYGELALTALLVLVVVCVVMLVVARYAGRWLGGRRDGDALVKVRARVPLEPRRALYVIEVGGRTLLVGSSEGGINVLSELDGEAVVAEAAPAGVGFAALVAQAIRRRGATAKGAGAGGDGAAAAGGDGASGAVGADGDGAAVTAVAAAAIGRGAAGVVPTGPARSTNTASDDPEVS